MRTAWLVLLIFNIALLIGSLVFIVVAIVVQRKIDKGWAELRERWEKYNKEFPRKTKLEQDDCMDFDIENDKKTHKWWEK